MPFNDTQLESQWHYKYQGSLKPSATNNRKSSITPYSHERNYENFEGLHKNTNTEDEFVL